MQQNAMTFLIAALVCGCAAENERGAVDQTPSAATNFDDFRDSSRRIIDGQEEYVVEWDLKLSPQELLGYYDRFVREGGARSTVNRRGGNDDIWPASQRSSLTYCISDNFGDLHARMVDEMDRATKAWEVAASINFIYRPEEDAACMNSNANVLIAVRREFNSQ